MAEINVGGASSLYMKVDITNVRQNVAGNSSTVKFVASMRQTSGNNWNQVPGVNFKVVVNGSTKADTTGFFLDVRGNVTQVFYTADVVIPHNTDGTKSFSWSFWFDPKGTYSTYKPTTLSGTQALPRIARVSNATLSANTFDFGESFTVYTNQTDPSFTHTISYIRGTTVTSLATAVKTSTAVTIPTAQISNYTTATTASMKIRTSTYSGSTLVGDYDLDVTVKVPSTAVPTIGAVSFTGSNAVFSGNNQFIASRDRLKATVANVTTSYSSAIKTYLYRVQQRTTFSMEGTANDATFPTFNFPATGSEVVNIQMAVVDARGRQSAWSTSPAIRVHAYQPPSIGATVITRNANVTTVNVRRNWSVTPLYEGGSAASPKNTGTLVVNYRAVGNTTWSSTTGGASGLSGVNSSVALSSFAGGTSYEFQIKLTDKFQTTTAPIIRIGTEFVPLDIGPKGIGVGKLHSDGAADLEVGSGGISSDGHYKSSNFSTLESSGSGISGFVAKGIPLTGDAYIERVLLLIPVSTTDTSNNNHVHGEIVLSKTGGNVWHTISVSAQSVWNATHANYTSFAQPHRMITCNYGGRKWLALRLVYEANPWNNMWFYGRAYSNMAGSQDMLKAISVYNHSSGTKLNSEIYDSMVNYTTNRQFYKDGQEVFHKGNDGSGSGLDADFLDGLHASAFAKTGDIPTVPTATYGLYTGSPRGVYTIASARILHGIATATGNSTSTFNSLGNTLTFPAAFHTNADYPVTVNYSISSNVTPVQNRMITVNIRDVTRTGFVWDVRDSASGTAPTGGTVYTLHWTAMGAR